MFFVYILRSLADKNLYIGSTSDLERRFAEHNSGEVFSTKSRRPFIVIYYEAFLVEKDARKREHNLKLRKRAWSQLKTRLENTLEKP